MAHEQGKVFYLVKKFVDEFLFPFSLVAFGIVVLPKLLLNTAVPYFVVPTKSMYPIIKPGDILFAEGWNLQDIKPGDIIVYHGYDALTHRWIWIIHRVREIKVVNGTEYIITAGDYNVQLCEQHNVSPVLCYDNGTLYPDQGLPLRKCPIFGQTAEFCIAGKAIVVNGVLLKIPSLGKYALELKRNI